VVGDYVIMEEVFYMAKDGRMKKRVKKKKLNSKRAKEKTVKLLKSNNF
jgi:hypothetical protein